MDAMLQQFFNIDIMVQAAPLIFRGLGMTLLVCAAVVPLGLTGGLMVALAGRAHSRGVRFIVALLVDIFRAAPPLVLLISSFMPDSRSPACGYRRSRRSASPSFSTTRPITGRSIAPASTA